MKRFVSAFALCFSLLFLLSFVLFPPVEAKEDVILTLLNLPAPPPPNPLARTRRNTKNVDFYNKSHPPGDDAAIEDLLDYWRYQAENHPALGYNPEPSERVIQRLKAEIEKDTKMLSRYLEILPDGDADFVKRIYDREGSNGLLDQDERQSIKRWLTYHSQYYSSDLARLARQAGDQGDYVGGQDELLALVKVDFDKAKPILDGLSANRDRLTSQVLAKWALYLHALETRSTSDVDTYRNELKAVVEDKTATAGMRDLALDALVKEKEWPGRDDWYATLLADETLADLRVNGSTYTGLTTIIYYSPDERYVQKMLELLKSDNPVVRTAVIKNLVLIFSRKKDPELVRALLPWLDDPKWAIDTNNTRMAIVTALTQIEVPESVPGLIKILDERAGDGQTQRYYGSNAPGNTKPSSTNMIANANAMAYAANAVANRPTNSVYTYPSRGGAGFYPYRAEAVMALAKQKDIQAVPTLRLLLAGVYGYERNNLISALLACRGFSLAEQMDALETASKGVREEINTEETAVNSGNTFSKEWGDPPEHFTVYGNTNAAWPNRTATASDIRQILGQQLLQASEITDELARAVVDRITSLDEKDPKLAAAYRRMILRWQNTAINLLLLSDVKRGVADADSIVRLLSQRKELREKQLDDVSAISTGKPTAIGIGACLLEDAADYKTILENANSDTKTALLACARLIRAPLPVPSVVPLLKNANKLLALAAERYLESEDSQGAGKAILSMHPNEAKILGATTAFFVDGRTVSTNDYLSALFQSVDDNDSIYNGWIDDNAEDLRKLESRIQNEVKQDNNILGIYVYDGNFVRIYKEKAVFTWEEEPSRYRERVLSKYEFDSLKSYLASNRVDELPPFLTCGGDYCEAKELLMLSRNGGRRVYMNGASPAFFAGLDKYFTDLRLSPSIIKYALSKEIPGLEVVFAGDDIHAETVWKNGDDVRVLVSNRATRKRVAAEVLSAAEESNGAVNGADSQDLQEKADRLVRISEELQYEGFSWRKLENGQLAESYQPPQVEYIPLRDSYSVQPTQEQWKARTPGVEIRASENGLFKLSGGKLIKIREGTYHSPVVTPNGRWVVVSKSGSEDGNGLVRIDLLSGKEFPIATQDFPDIRASAYVTSINKVLLVGSPESDGEGFEGIGAFDEENDRVSDDPQPQNMLLLDPETGKVQPVNGEFRPLSQETFRPLQKSSNPGEFWAAMPDTEKNETQIGTLDARIFRFKPVLLIPKIAFNSMNMWVDEPGARIYFVYRGHLLSLPFDAKKTKGSQIKRNQ